MVMEDGEDKRERSRNKLAPFWLGFGEARPGVFFMKAMCRIMCVSKSHDRDRARARGYNNADGKIAPIATATSKGNLLAAVGRQGKAMALLTWYSLYCACSRDLVAQRQRPRPSVLFNQLGLHPIWVTSFDKEETCVLPSK